MILLLAFIGLMVLFGLYELSDIHRHIYNVEKMLDVMMGGAIPLTPEMKKEVDDFFGSSENFKNFGYRPKDEEDD